MKSPITVAFLPSKHLPMPLTAIQQTPTRRRRHATMAASPSTPPSNQVWRKITVPDRYLRLSQTLCMGQAFRWYPNPTLQPAPNSSSSSSTNTREWAGCINETLYILRQAEPEPLEDQLDPVYYIALPTGDEATIESQRSVLIDYLRADADYTDLFAEFRDKDAAFDHIFPYLYGVRTIRHDPVECLFSYICSSNNHMKRTATMITHLADTYGPCVATYEGKTYNAFPSVQTLADKATEVDLRKAGFGYRANYIVSTAKALVQVSERDGLTPEEMLLSWRTLSRQEVEKRLTQFPGIGRKVAGCIALMSLDQLGEIPVDTHVWQMGLRYLPELKGKNLSKRTYDAIGECFRQKFGEKTAGLAHNILFAAELDEFKELIPGGVPNKLWAGAKTKKKKENRKKRTGSSSRRTMLVEDADDQESLGRKRTRRGSVK